MGRVGFDEKVAGRLADTMFALSTPSRVQIFGCLLGGPRSVSELMEALDMEQSAVSHQLRVLRDDHVVTLLQTALRHVQERAATPRGARGRRVL